MIKHNSLLYLKQAGFTLIEILVVMVILGVLVSVAAGSFVSSQQKSRDTRRKSDLKQISSALEAYYNDRGEYPASSTGKIVGCANDTVCDWGEGFQNGKGTVYMAQLPEDPRGNDYYYEAAVDGKSYQIYAALENDKDPSIARDGDGNPQYYTGITCGEIECNYGVSSPNTKPEEAHSLSAD